MNIPSWFLKHKPKKFTELEFSDDSNFKVLEWLNSHRNGGLLHISGGIGCGKTSLVHMAAKACKYKVIEYSELNSDMLKSLNKKTLDGLSSLILVDDSDFSSVNFIPKFINLPVIFTSNNSFFDCLRIMRPENQLILKVVKKILKLEKKTIDDRVILKICQICNSDFRAVINYCQLFSCVNEFKDFKAIERFSAHSLNYNCKLIFSKRLCFEDLERVYSEKMATVCLNNVIKKTKDINSLKCFEAFSDLADYPDKYKFITLDPINKIRLDYEYIQEDSIEYSNKHGHQNPIHFLPNYQRSLQNKWRIRHLQKIFERYQIKNLSAIDKEINDYIDINVINSKDFKYKYHTGASNAVKRDISISELYEL